MTINKIENRNRVRFNGVLLIVVIGFVVSIKAIENYNDKKQKKELRSACSIEKMRMLKGVILSAYYDDDINVKAFRMNFTNGESYITPIFLKSLNGFVEAGDSVYKEPNSFRFFIFRKDGKATQVVEDTVECSKL